MPAIVLGSYVFGRIRPTSRSQAKNVKKMCAMGRGWLRLIPQPHVIVIVVVHSSIL